MAWLQLLILVLTLSTAQGQPACPQGLTTTPSTTITTNDVILIKTPLLAYNDAANACECLGGGYTAANETELLGLSGNPPYLSARYNQTQAAYTGLVDLVTSNLGRPVIVWIGPRTKASDLDCPDFEVTTAIGTGLVDCQQPRAILCSRSNKVYNPLGSACDNVLQLCQRGSYCNLASGKCETDTVCFPNNPCITAALTSQNYDTSGIVCNVTPDAPGGYTCQCGIVQAVTTTPGPQTCVECPSANPCAITNCPAGTECGFTCGAGPAGCFLPNGTRVPQVVPTPPPQVPSTPESGVCGAGPAKDFPVRCYFNSDPQGRYVCCDSAGCDGFLSDNSFPRCKGNGYGAPGFTPASGTPVPPTPAPPPPSPPSGSQGVCGSGDAQPFPVRCYFNSDPQGRYVCCDPAGCDGFNQPGNLFPHCKASGFVPPGYGVNAPAPAPPPPPSGSQGVCGSGAAAAFPQRCYFNSDPQGRYVCCDLAGCDGFNPPGNLFPHCKANGYVPPGYGV